MQLVKRLNTYSINDGLADSLSESNDLLAEEESFELARQALESLPLQEQILLRQKYEQRLSLEELAQIHNPKLSAVKMQLKRSREKIQHYYAQQQAR